MFRKRLVLHVTLHLKKKKFYYTDTLISMHTHKGAPTDDP